MKAVDDKKILDKYNSIIETAKFLAEDGNYELSMEVTSKALEMFYLNHNTENIKPEEEKIIKNTELLLTQKYLSYKTNIDRKKNDYLKIFIKTSIICGIITFCVFLTTIFIGTMISRNLSQIISSIVTPEITHLRKEIVKQIPLISTKIQDEVPKVSDRFQKEMPKISNNIANFSDAKIKKIIENKTEEVVKENLPLIVNDKIKSINKK